MCPLRYLSISDSQHYIFPSLWSLVSIRPYGVLLVTVVIWRVRNSAGLGDVRSTAGLCGVRTVYDIVSLVRLNRCIFRLVCIAMCSFPFHLRCQVLFHVFILSLLLAVTSWNVGIAGLGLGPLSTVPPIPPQCTCTCISGLIANPVRPGSVV